MGSEYGDSAAVSGTLQVTGTIFTPVDSLTLENTIDTDADEGNIFTVTLTGSTLSTLGNPTNLKDGAVYRWIIKQDSSGGSDLLFGTNFKFVAGMPPSMISASYGVDILEGISDGTYVYVHNHATNITGTTDGTPTSLIITSAATCKLWLDASDADTITESDDDISKWEDKSGLNYHAEQATAANKPEHSASAINGLDIITFDGADQYFDLDGTGEIFEADDVTYFAIVQVYTGELIGHIVGGGSSAAGYQISYGQGLTVNAGKSVVKSVNASTGIVITCPDSMADNETTLIVGKITASGSSVRLDGVEEATDTTNGANPYEGYYSSVGAGRGLYTGGATAGTHADEFDGAIGELIVYTGGALTDVEIRSVEKYLVSKWGITDSYRADE